MSAVNTINNVIRRYYVKKSHVQTFALRATKMHYSIPDMNSFKRVEVGHIILFMMMLKLLMYKSLDLKRVRYIYCMHFPKQSII